MFRRPALLQALPALSLGLALAALPGPLPAQSQATTGIIRGVVSDPSGNPVTGASVVVHETQTGFQRALPTNERGVFVASLLPLGTYDVTVRGVGFAESKKTGIPLRVGETVDLQFKLGAVQLAAVTVEATTPVVDASKIENSTRLSDRAVGGLPNNGRNYLNLTLLTPNVAIVQGPDGDELSVAGQRGIHNNVSVDGADFNNPFFGEQRGGQRPAFTFNLDALQELVVVADGANAEFGRSSGGFVNVVTKSGTNQLRGSLHYFGKFDQLSGTPSHGGVSYQPDFAQHQFGFTLGGPIKQDRALKEQAAERPAGLPDDLPFRQVPVARRRLRGDPPHQRCPRLPRQVRLPAVAEARSLAEVQLHVVSARERHFRCGQLGAQRQWAGEGLVQRAQWQPDVIPVPTHLQRAPVPVLARRPTASL